MRSSAVLLLISCSSSLVHPKGVDGGVDGIISDSDSDSDADVDADSDSDSDSGGTGETGGGISCGDPWVDALVSTPSSGTVLSVSAQLDLCLGVSATGWYSLSLWDAGSIVCKQGWQVESVDPYVPFYPNWYGIDWAGTLMFGSLVQLEGDCFDYGYGAEPGANPVQVALDLSGGGWIYLESGGYPHWGQVYPPYSYAPDSSMLVIDTPDGFDVEFEWELLDFVVP